LREREHTWWRDGSEVLIKQQEAATIERLAEQARLDRWLGASLRRRADAACGLVDGAFCHACRKKKKN